VSKPVPEVSPAIPGDQSIKKTGRPEAQVVRPGAGMSARERMSARFSRPSSEYRLYPVLMHGASTRRSRT